MIYIVLGMLYESFIHPITILSGLPSAVFGALLTLVIFHKQLDLYAFVGIIMLFGVVKKNAIMMIDFAIDAQQARATAPYDAIWQGCLLRFRPIMMTTVAALFGTLPIALGYGEGARRPPAARPGRGRRPGGQPVPDALHHAGNLPLPGTPAGVVPRHAESPRNRRRRALKFSSFCPHAEVIPAWGAGIEAGYFRGLNRTPLRPRQQRFTGSLTRRFVIPA